MNNTSHIFPLEDSLPYCTCSTSNPWKYCILVGWRTGGATGVLQAENLSRTWFYQNMVRFGRTRDCPADTGQWTLPTGQSGHWCPTRTAGWELPRPPFVKAHSDLSAGRRRRPPAGTSVHVASQAPGSSSIAVKAYAFYICGLVHIHHSEVFHHSCLLRASSSLFSWLVSFTRLACPFFESFCLLSPSNRFLSIYRSRSSCSVKRVSVSQLPISVSQQSPFVWLLSVRHSADRSVSQPVVSVYWSAFCAWLPAFLRPPVSLPPRIADLLDLLRLSTCRLPERQFGTSLVCLFRSFDSDSLLCLRLSVCCTSTVCLSSQMYVGLPFLLSPLLFLLSPLSDNL